MLPSLPVPLLKGLAEVEDLRETVGQLQTLETSPELERLRKEYLGQLSSQVPLPVTVQEGACAVGAQSCEVLAS